MTRNAPPSTHAPTQTPEQVSPQLGKLYGLGTGPGAGDLLTLRAMRTLQAADVIAIPKKQAEINKSFAWNIVTSEISADSLNAERLFLWFPMTKDSTITVPAWLDAAQQLATQLQAGKDVVFITEGDASVYSSWGYIKEILCHQFPGLETEVIPSVSSVTAVPAATGLPLAEGEERFCVVPATYGIEMLRFLVDEFDTILLIKAGRMIPQLIALLDELDLLHTATYVSHATLDKQEIYTDLREVPPENRYFSMVQLSIRKRKGALRGQAELSELARSVLAPLPFTQAEAD